jgi:hypothetical protein
VTYHRAERMVIELRLRARVPEQKYGTGDRSQD